MPICLQKPSCQQNPLLAAGNNRKSLLPTNSSRPLFNQIAIFSGILTEHFNCKCFLLYTCELLEISPSGKDISLSIMTSRILASVHEQGPVKNWSRRTLIYNTVLHIWTCPRSGAHLLPRSVTRVMYRSNRSFNIPPPLPGIPRAFDTFFPGRREFDYQSLPAGGGEFDPQALGVGNIWTALSISCEISKSRNLWRGELSWGTRC